MKHETIPIKKASNQVKHTQSHIENEIKSFDHFFNQNLQKSVLNLQIFSSSSLRSLLNLSKQFDLLFEKLNEAKETLIRAEKEKWEERRRREESRAEGFRRIRRILDDLLKEKGEEDELGKQAKFIHSFNILKNSLNMREVNLFDDNLHEKQENLPNLDKIIHLIQSLSIDSMKIKDEDVRIKKAKALENDCLMLEGRKQRPQTELNSSNKKALKFSNEESFKKSSRLLFKEPFYDSLILVKKLRISSIFRVIMPSELSPNSFKLIFRLTKQVKEIGVAEKGGVGGGREKGKGSKIVRGEEEGGKERGVEEIMKEDWWNEKRNLIGFIRTKKTISGFYLEEGLREEEEEEGATLKEEEKQVGEDGRISKKWLFSIKNKIGLKPIRIQVKNNLHVRFSRITRRIVWGNDEYVVKYNKKIIFYN